MVRKVWYSENADVYPGIITRNNAVLEYEKFIHRLFYPYIIHPYSTFRVNWQKAYLILIPLRVTVTSIIWALLPHRSFLYQAILLAFKFSNAADIIMKFFTGYIEADTEIAVLDPRRIAKRYLLTFFLFDFLPCIPIETFFFIHDEECVVKYNLKHTRNCQVVVDIFTAFAVFRVVTFFEYCRNLTKIMMWNYFLLGMISVTFFLYVLLMMSSDLYTFMYLMKFGGEYSEFSFVNVSEMKKVPEKKNYSLRFHQYVSAMITLLLDCLFSDSVSPFSNVYVKAFIFLITCFCSIIFVAYSIRYGLLKLNTKEKFLDLESRVITFVRKKNLSSVLGHKTLLYFQILQENKYCMEDEILYYIPDTFKAEIFFHLCRPLLKNFYAFEDLPTYVLRLLAESMRYQLCLPNEVVMRKDEPKLRIYFVQRGTVALYSSKHVELYHFEGGSSFNGRNLILGEPAWGTYAISIEVAEIYVLDQEDFLRVMRTYPKLLKAVLEKLRGDKTGSSFIIE